MLERIKRLGFQYIILTSLACFIYTFTYTRNPFIALMSSLGGGVASIDLSYIFYIIGSLVSGVGYEIIVYIIVNVAWIPYLQVIKYLNIGILPILLYIIFYKKYRLGKYMSKLYNNIYINYCISYITLSTFIVNLYWFTFIADDRIKLVDTIPVQFVEFYRTSYYLQGGLLMLNNKILLFDINSLIIATMSHIMVTTILSILNYHRYKSYKKLIKINLVLHLLIIALTIGAYIVNLNIIMS